MWRVKYFSCKVFPSQSRSCHCASGIFIRCSTVCPGRTLPSLCLSTSGWVPQSLAKAESAGLGDVHFVCQEMTQVVDLVTGRVFCGVPRPRSFAGALMELFWVLGAGQQSRCPLKLRSVCRLVPLGKLKVRSIETKCRSGNRRKDRTKMFKSDFWRSMLTLQNTPDNLRAKLRCFHVISSSYAVGNRDRGL